MVRHDTNFIKKPFSMTEIHAAIPMKSGVLNLFVGLILHQMNWI